MPEFFNSRLPIASLADLKGKKIRVNNSGETLLLNELGATPVPMPVNVISTAIVNGTIDAALVPPTPLVDYGIKRVATHHYMLGTSGAPLALVMNCQDSIAFPRRRAPSSANMPESGKPRDLSRATNPSTSKSSRNSRRNHAAS